ncbi:MAG TPA: helix-turn-helix transcriptional regulator [Caulobacteraceae bacterium]
MRDWREFRGLTQAQLAAMAETEGSVISLLESGDRGLSDKWLRRLAPLLETTPGLLLEHHPDDVGVAVLETWAKLPAAKKAAVMTQLMVDVPPSETPPEDPRGEVVNFRPPSRRQSEDRASKSNKKR